MKQSGRELLIRDADLGQPLYGFIVGATIGKGRITAIDATHAVRSLRSARLGFLVAGACLTGFLFGSTGALIALLIFCIGRWRRLGRDPKPGGTNSGSTPTSRSRASPSRRPAASIRSSPSFGSAEGPSSAIARSRAPTAEPSAMMASAPSSTDETGALPLSRTMGGGAMIRREE